ncbi:MAG: YlmC/YmxH family sporulation protein [Clostridia bacterium]|nr:YlmC/YmxH family sporulation protein [Clostridia bacterium]
MLYFRLFVAYDESMELSYSELTKRDVINISDGRCLGRITDIKLKFPEGKLVGIIVPGRKVRGLFKCFDKTQVYIEESKIIKIGGDVILVDVRCFDGDNRPPRPIKPPKKPPCPPPCGNHSSNFSAEDFASSFDGRIDDGDY